MRKIKLLLISITIILLVSCDKNINEPETEIISWVFVANEGEFDPNGPTNTGTISMINNLGDVYETESLGDIVHSLAIYSNKLIVSVNNSQKILIFDISEEGLSENYNEILIEDSPREIMIINDKAYFTTWNPDYNIYTTINGYIRVLNLQNLQIEESIEVGIMPEGMLVKDGYLWVANSGESSVSKINLSSNTVDMNYSVGSGPQFLTELSGNIYIARTFYDQNWNPAYGTSMISSGEVSEVVHQFSAGSACGGSIMTLDNKVYRSFDGGIAQIDSNLEIDELSRIGSFNQSNVYHVETFNGNIYFAITDYGNLNKLSILNQSGDELSTFNVGKNPGDFAFWHK